MTITVNREGDRWVARFPWSVAAKDIVKAAGFKFDGQRKLWWTDKSEVAAKLDGNGIARLNAEREAAHRQVEEAIAASHAQTSNLDIPLSAECIKKGWDYFPYQKAGIAYAMNRPATLIGDEMGLGKTIQSIGVINLDDSIKNVLVICKASLKLNWQKELTTWLARDLPVPSKDDILRGRFPSGGIAIINYENVEKYRSQIDAIDWDLLVVDESHMIKNRDAKRTQYILGRWHKDPAKIITPIKAKRRIFMTGTPILNRPEELWTIVHSLDPNGLGRSWRGFHMRYCAMSRNRYGYDTSGASNLEELQIKLRSTFMVRRLKADVMTELPPKRRQVIALEPLTARETAALEAEARYHALEADVETLRAEVERLSEDEASEAYKDAVRRLHEAQTVAFSETSRVRHETAVAKIPQVIDHIKDALESEAKVLVMAHHHDVIDAIVEQLHAYGVVKLDGRDSLKARDEAEREFQTNPRRRIFVGSIQAAGAGLTLHAANHVIFAELDWVPGIMSQAEDRAHRIGQRESVLVQHIVLDGSMDARMADMLVEKQNVIDAAMDNDAALPKLASLPSASTAAPDDLKPEVIAAIHRALQELALMCDGARTLDGHGFNKLDTQFGKSLAAAPRLSQKQAKAGRRLAIKYGRQLPRALLETIKNG